MDVISRAVFNKIALSCKDGGYAIIDGAEFADALPEGERRAAGEIEGALKALQKQGYIDIKYARGDMYCVAALKAALPDEQKEDEKTHSGAACPTVVEVKQKFSKIAAAAYAAAAFLGGAAGSAIVCAIFAAV